MTTQAINSLSTNLEEGFYALGDPIQWGTCSWIFTRIFTKINPTGGFLLGASPALVYKITKPLFDTIFANPESNQPSRNLGKILHTCSSIVIGYHVAILITPISLTKAVYIFFSIIAISMYNYNLK